VQLNSDSRINPRVYEVLDPGGSVSRKRIEIKSTPHFTVLGRFPNPLHSSRGPMKKKRQLKYEVIICPGSATITIGTGRLGGVGQNHPELAAASRNCFWHCCKIHRIGRL
jgi:hypothetical protein